MQVFSLHPIDTDVVDHFVRAVTGTTRPDATWQDWWRDDYARLVDLAAGGDEKVTTVLTSGLAQALAQANPSVVSMVFSLSMWEARLDRGVGMMLRPPARLFLDGGLPPAAARAMPIRLDPQLGPMGGAWIPDRLIDDVARFLDERLERTVRRLVEAELPAIETFSAAHVAIDTARRAGQGLYEAVDVIGPDGEAWPGMQIVVPTKDHVDRELRARIDQATRPDRKSALLSRLFKRA